MSRLSKIYSWAWFHTEFLVANKLNRRPFTYIMKDWIFLHPRLTGLVIALWYAGVIALSWWHPHITLVLGIVSSFILAHLVWGSKWIKGQQETPPYLEDIVENKR